MDEDFSIYADVCDLYDRYGPIVEQPAHPQFAQFLNELEIFAAAGCYAAAQALGDELSQPGPQYRPEDAYKWYFIAFSQQGYSVEWKDNNHIPPYYCGPPGDFRNEAMVSDLVVELGWERSQELDLEAAQWMEQHRLSRRHS